MKLKFTKVHIENFMSLGEVDIELDNLGYTLVSGVNNAVQDMAKSNGSGKSSIFDAIMWCLTGDTIRGNKDVVNLYGEDGAVVSLHFTVDGKDYRVIRSKNSSIWKTNLKIYVNDDDISGKGIRDSEKLLKEYLPDLTYELISSVILLGQGLPNRFTNNSPSGRKDMLEKLCKSDFMIQDLKERITDRKSKLQEQLRAAEDDVLVLDTKISVAKTAINATKSKLAEVNDPTMFDEQIQNQQNCIEYEQNLIKEYTESLENQRALESSTTLALAQLSKEKYEIISSIHDELDPVIDEFRLIRANIQASLQVAEAELRKQENITDVCPTCGQKLPEVHKPDTTEAKKNVESLQEQLKQESSKLDAAQESLNRRVQEVTIQFSDKENEFNLSLNEIRSLMKSIADNITSITTTVTGMQKELQNLSAAKASATEFLQTANQTIAENEKIIEDAEQELLYKYKIKDDLSVRLGIVNKFNTVIARDFRGYLLQSIIEFIDKRAKVYSNSIFNTELISFILDGNNISISYNNKEYESLSGGEKQKVDLIIQFSIRDMMCTYTGFSTNILVLDEIFDNLDAVGSSQVINLISTELHDISSVFLVTHHGAELNVPYDNEIVVVKGSDGVSRLQ